MEKITRRRFFGLAGGVVLGSLGYSAGRGLMEKMMSPPVEFLRDTTTAWTYDRANSESLEQVLSYLSAESRNMYGHNHRDQPGLDKDWLDYLETTIRQSQKIPTDKLPGAKEAIGLKERILRKTKGWFSNNKKKEEVVEPQSNQDYAKNYYALSQYRMSVMARVVEIEESMDQIAQKALTHKGNNFGEWHRGLDLEEGLIKEHGKYIDLMRGFKSLTPLQIQEGANDSDYAQVMEKVRSYGVQTYEITKSPIISQVSNIVGVGTGTAGFFLGSKVLGGSWSAGIGGLIEPFRLCLKRMMQKQREKRINTE